MRLRKGREFMRKIITVVSALVLIGCIAVIFYGCGANDEEMTTTTPATTSAPATDNIGQTDMMDANDGMITDVSGDGDNGVIGDIVTDVSEGVSSVVTDVSENASEMMD